MTDYDVKLHWLIDVDIIGEQHQNVPQQLRALGHKVTTLSATKDLPEWDFRKNKEFNNSKDGIVVYPFHGSFEELKQVKNKLYTPSTYGLGPSILRSHYTSYIPHGWFLNNDSIMTTWGNLCSENRLDLYERYGWDGEIFIRPDSGYKVFTGQLINLHDFVENKAKLESISGIVPETIIWTSSVKSIAAEYRVWISNRKIVTHSEYSWDDKNIDIYNCLPETPTKVLELAAQIANHRWQIDRIYVVDISTYRGEAAIIEFNSFSCSGLYECDSELLFKTVSEDIVAEWKE